MWLKEVPLLFKQGCWHLYFCADLTPPCWKSQAPTKKPQSLQFSNQSIYHMWVRMCIYICLSVSQSWTLQRTDINQECSHKMELFVLLANTIVLSCKTILIYHRRTAFCFRTHPYKSSNGLYIHSNLEWNAVEILKYWEITQKYPYNLHW